VALKEYTGPRHGDRKTLRLPGGATMTMIYVAPGSFMMGSSTTEEGRYDNETQHHVTLTKGYWLGETEVTQAQWESVMGSNPSYFKGASRPVEKVSWEDCQQFIAKVNREARRQFGGDARLPTEAEWEYACRAGSNTALSNGKLTILGKYNGPELDEVAWYGGNSSVGFELSNGYDCSGWAEKQYEGTKAGTHPVAKKTKNPWGFYDMHGNVWEWCQDWYGAYPSGAVTDPIGQASGVDRVLRGGGWSNFARYCRSANRDWFRPGFRRNNCGFRLCCSALP
jgi:formylglycine-generating enzyme required for sulfatase activity